MVMHVICVLVDGDWKKARKEKKSHMHILEPVDVNVIFSRAMVVKDSRMAKYEQRLPIFNILKICTI